MSNKFKIYFIALFFVFLFFPSRSFSAVAIIINNYPDQITQLEEFNIDFAATGLEINGQYYVKTRLGKDSGSMSKGETFNDISQTWLGDTNSWDSFPIFSANDAGNLNGLIKSRAGSSSEIGANILVIRFRKVGSTTNIDSSSVSLEILSAPTLVPTLVPTSTFTPTPTPLTKAFYKINKTKDNNGNTLSSVKIYVDNLYTHHEDDEILTFCDNCFCDNDKNVACGLGEHTIKLEKEGCSDWTEVKNFSAGNDFEVNPILDCNSPTSLPEPTLTPTLDPTSVPTAPISQTPIATISLTPTDRESSASQEAQLSPEVLGTQSGDTLVLGKLSTESGQAGKSKLQKNKFNFWPLVIMIPGIGMIGFSIYSLIKQNKNNKASKLSE